MNKDCLLALLIFCLIASWAHAESVVHHEPTLADVLETALAVSYVSHQDLDDYSRRLTKAHLAPRLYLSYKLDRDRDSGITVNDNIDVDSGAVTVGPDENEFASDLSHGHEFRVQAIWDFSELIFNRFTPVMAREKREHLALKMEMIDKLTKIYWDRQALLFQWQGPQDLAAKKSGGLTVQDKLRLAIDRLTSELDAFTEHRFAGRWRKL